MAKKLKMLIAGDWREGGSGEVIDVIDPGTEEVVAKLCMADTADLQEALASAAAGFENWRARSPAERGRLIRGSAERLRANIEEMARTLTIEQGKTLGQSRWEIAATAAYFDDLAACAERVYGRAVPREASGVSRSINYEPIGPVFAVAPWNLPAMLPGRKIATALAAGCSIIVKPAKETPETAYLIARCCQEAGVPGDVINVVSGNSSAISELFIGSAVIRKLSFTGSTEVGKQLAALCGQHMKKATMELGGHAPVIICDDTDVERAASMLVPARYANAGQSCIAPTRFFVQRHVYDSFVNAFTARAAALKVGHGLKDSTDMGPLASKRRVAAMEHLVEDALDHGARLTLGGKRLHQKGFYFEPTVLCDVPDEAEIMREEPFGPLTPCAGFDDLAEALARANSTPYGLAAYVFTASLDTANRLVAGLDAGMVGINTLDVAAPQVPFGGVRDSGTGREGSIEGVLESMVSKTVSTAVQ